MAKSLDIRQFQIKAVQLIQTRIDELAEKLGLKGWPPMGPKIDEVGVGIAFRPSTLLWLIEPKISLHGPVENPQAQTHRRRFWLFMVERCWLDLLDQADGELRAATHVKAMAEILALRAEREISQHWTKPEA